MRRKRRRRKNRREKKGRKEGRNTLEFLYGHSIYK